MINYRNLAKLLVQRAALLVALVSVVALFIVSLIPEGNLGGIVVKGAIVAVVSSALGAGAVGLLWEYSTMQAFTRQVQEDLHTILGESLQLNSAAVMAEAEGMVGITRDFHRGVPWREYIKDADSIDICWWTGRNWFRENELELRGGCNNDHPYMRIALPDTSDSNILDQMVRDSGLEAKYLQAATAETIEFLKEFPTQCIQIYMLPRVPRYMYLRMGAYTLMASYALSPGRNFARPTIICKTNGPLGISLGEDFKKAVQNSRELVV